MDTELIFYPEEEYRRREIHDRIGGQRRTGISTPRGQKRILLFTGESSERYGYKDGWSESGHFLFMGEGQYGDMAFRHGNRAIRDHLQDGKSLHLFIQLNRGIVRYVGEMVLSRYFLIEGPDLDGKLRKMIIFELNSL